MSKEKMPIWKLTTNAINIKLNRVRDRRQSSLNNRLHEIAGGTVEENLNAFTSIMCKVSKEKLGTAIREK